MKPLSIRSGLIALGIFLAPAAMAQHLWWKPKPHDRKFTCLYGEIQVLATSDDIYYCGCTWWPGKPAGGYTGIQDPGGGRHNMIFSIWDTSDTLHPKVVAADQAAVYSRFGGEGTGAHSHLDYHWELGETYRYYVTKLQDASAENTLTSVYFYDAHARKWVHEATISNPNNGSESVPTFGGGLNGFLENWASKDRAVPKLAVYRLWLGTNTKDLAEVTDAGGDGKWGVLNGTFYLAEGDDAALAAVIDKVKGSHGYLTAGNKGQTLSVPPRKIPHGVLRGLDHLPKAPPVTSVPAGTAASGHE